MTARHAHLVGSLPGSSTEDAMSEAMRRLGPLLTRLPDGETGDRRNWIIHIIESLRSHPDLEVVKRGDWSDYDKTPRLRIRKGHRLYGAALDFGHVATTEEAFPVLERLAAEHDRPDLSYQVGVPGDLDMAVFTLGMPAALRHRGAFTEATVSEMRRAHAVTGDRGVFQIEIPVELVMLGRLPGPARPAAARVLGGQIGALAAGAPEGSRLGIHLCLGDMNHKAFGQLGDAGPLVDLANAIGRAWPPGRTLEFVHAPLAAADQPPSTDPAFYEPLRRLALPDGCRFVAGYAHEDQPMADQRRIRTMVEAQLEAPADVSTPCGLGRRSEPAGYAALDRIGELCTD